ncbi:MAG: hypothetical protein HDT28_01650 [Clostridiales bacterium]|nr:hypothetical protein [Clostridiales bacterium]
MDYPFIDQLQEQLLLDSFSIFCGAGATADLTRRKWEDIFHEKTKQFYDAKLSNDIYLLSDFEKNYYNADNFYKDIKRKLSVTKGLSKHIEAIIKLNLNQIWTTNFDVIIEDAIYKNYGVQPTVLSTSRDLLTKNLNSEHIVYKLNGTINDENSMVLTKTDFFEYFKKQRLFFELLKRQLVLDSFLFIGYSFQDDLVLNALREIKEVFPENGKIHYRFTIREAVKTTSEHAALKEEFTKYEQQYFMDKYNIQSIVLDNFSNIDDYLNELYRRFCNHNILFCGSFRSIENDLRIHIEQIIDEVIRELYNNKFNIYSGNGRGLGEIIVARTRLHARMPYNRFVNRPLIFTGDSNKIKQEKNEQIEKDCNTMLIFCGQDEKLGNSRNVINQFKKFISNNNSGKLVIPVPSTGYAAKEIFNSDIYRDTYTYKTMSSELNLLNSMSNPKEIASLIVNLILRYRKEP